MKINIVFILLSLTSCQQQNTKLARVEQTIGTEQRKEQEKIHWKDLP